MTTKAGKALLERWFPNGPPREYQGAPTRKGGVQHPVWVGLVDSIEAIEREAAAAERVRIRAAWDAHDPFRGVPREHDDWRDGESWANHCRHAILGDQP